MDKDNVFDDLNKLNSYLGSLDERGLILSLAAFSEDSLGKMLLTFMLDNKASKELIEGFNAPLGTFSSRIKACFSLGLITEGQYKDLELLRKIRNKFSHSWENISIDDKDISQQIQNLSFSRIDFECPKNNYEKLKKSISCLLIEIKVTTSQIKKKHLKARLVGSNVNIGFTGNYEVQVNDIKRNIETIKSDLASPDKKIKSFALHTANLLIERLPYVQFNHDDLDIFSDQLVDILELKYELFNLLGVNEGRSLSQDEKERMKKSFIEGITNQS
ncbi:MltR family transcriptional regulator [Enterobacter hormaechei]|uniref:MltR family transcriptional regulator n=1 Tax=Enterobacter hormaechei TaxID=158836 RepID=UPI00079BFB71|nr:MltR family transcriptional regulator [Enterobacter hormaechei]SAI48098.1 mannitol repressor protein [Enterobacter hormaechei]